jgi:hypothetical protein
MGLGPAFAEGEGRASRGRCAMAAASHLRAPDPARAALRDRRGTRVRRPLPGRAAWSPGFPRPVHLATLHGGLGGAAGASWGTVTAPARLLHRILRSEAALRADYLHNRSRGPGVMFDTWGGILADEYETFSLAYARKVLQRVTAPKFCCKGGALACGDDAGGLRCGWPRLDDRSCQPRKLQPDASRSESGSRSAFAREGDRAAASAPVHSARRQDTFQSRPESRRKHRWIRFLRY